MGAGAGRRPAYPDADLVAAARQAQRADRRDFPVFDARALDRMGSDARATGPVRRRARHRATAGAGGMRQVRRPRRAVENLLPPGGGRARLCHPNRGIHPVCRGQPGRHAGLWRIVGTHLVNHRPRRSCLVFSRWTQHRRRAVAELGQPPVGVRL